MSSPDHQQMAIFSLQRLKSPRRQLHHRVTISIPHHPLVTIISITGRWLSSSLTAWLSSSPGHRHHRLAESIFARQSSSLTAWLSSSPGCHYYCLGIDIISWWLSASPGCHYHRLGIDIIAWPKASSPGRHHHRQPGYRHRLGLIIIAWPISIV